MAAIRQKCQKSSVGVAASRTNSRKGNISRAIPQSMWITFNRARIIRELQSPHFLRKIRVFDRNIEVECESWQDYWGDNSGKVASLEKVWTSNISSGFTPETSMRLAELFFEILTNALIGNERVLIEKLLGMEVISIHDGHAGERLAAATTTYRNPVFLRQIAGGNRKNRYCDLMLLPLVTIAENNTIDLYFHYRKNSLIKSTEDALLFYLHEDLDVRGKSFTVLQKIVGDIVPEWDSKIGQRVQWQTAIVEPIINNLRKKTSEISILDIGSGAGAFTSRLLANIFRDGKMEEMAIKLTMVDQMKLNPAKQFSSPMLLRHVGEIEFINDDYGAYITRMRQCQSTYDIIFVFRMLHNFSRFKLMSNSNEKNRYSRNQWMDAYFNAISTMAPSLLHDGHGGHDLQLRRLFNKDCLILPDGKSMIEAVAKLGRHVIIEDGDLFPNILLEHCETYGLSNICIFDLSRRFRLASSHVYRLCGNENALIGEGEKIWPR